MLKRTMSALAIAAMASVGVAQAQENATLTLKSGERISGQLIDMGGVGFTIKVNNEDRRIPTGDVAIIDFTGGRMTNDDWNRVSSGATVTWLRNGQTVTGQLYDISGTTPAGIPPISVTFGASYDHEFANDAHFLNRLRYGIRGKKIPRKPVDIRSEENKKAGEIPFVNHHPKTVTRMLKDAGFEIEAVLSGSNLRSPALKRAVGKKPLLALEKILQPVLAPLYFGPSVWLRLKKNN